MLSIGIVIRNLSQSGAEHEHVQISGLPCFIQCMYLQMDVIVARDQILMDATRLVESHVFFEFNTINLIAT